MPFGLKVLVVDDMTSSCLMLAHMLTRLGISNVDTAHSGEEALKCLQKTSFDLVISDYHMPSMNGLNLLRHMRTMPATSNTEFILATGRDSADIIEQSEKLGVRKVLIKPMRMDHLMDVLVTVARSPNAESKVA